MTASLVRKQRQINAEDELLADTRMMALRLQQLVHQPVVERAPLSCASATSATCCPGC
jgi:hypothetical protein